MARRPGWSRSFRRDPKLQQYFLDRVVPTGNTLGTGSYGSVLEVSDCSDKGKLSYTMPLARSLHGL